MLTLEYNELVFILMLRGRVGCLWLQSRDRFPVVSLGIFSVVPDDGTMRLGVDSASENEYQGFLLG